MTKLKRKVVDTIFVVDIEATCSDGPDRHTFENEIIEIGVTPVTTPDFEILPSKSIIIKPVFSKITPFCTNLTTLTPEYVEENGVDFQKARDIWIDTYGDNTSRSMWASYGEYDRTMISSQCNRSRVREFLPEDHINIKMLAAMRFGKRMGMAAALKEAGLTLEGTHHRGDADSRNIARLLVWLLGFEVEDR